MTAENSLTMTEMFSCSEIKDGITQPITGVGWWNFPVISSGVVQLSRKLDILLKKKKERCQGIVCTTYKLCALNLSPEIQNRMQTEKNPKMNTFLILRPSY